MTFHWRGMQRLALHHLAACCHVKLFFSRSNSNERAMEHFYRNGRKAGKLMEYSLYFRILSVKDTIYINNYTS